MSIETYAPLVTVIFCLGLLVGYLWGRKDGKQEGFTLGFAYAPLEMRRQVLIKGTCITCGRKLTEESPPQAGNLGTN